MNDLEMYRESLALCDDKIIDALVERSKIVEKIMAYKEEYGMPILQPQQEAKQALRLEEKLNGNKYREEIKDIFECIRMNSKKIQARKLFDYNIVMIGFMGAGKSTVARTLGEWFDMEIVEMDELISDRQRMSIPEIFEKHGEEIGNEVLAVAVTKAQPAGYVKEWKINGEAVNLGVQKKER